MATAEDGFCRCGRTRANAGVSEAGVRKKIKIEPEDDSVAMDPSVWSALPRELIWLVIAHLPLPRLRSLRRSALAGKWDLNLADLGFRQLCAQQHANMCAVMVRSNPAFAGSMGRRETRAGRNHSGLVYSLGLHSAGDSLLWQKLRLRRKFGETGEFSCIMRSSDGGLVCFALTRPSEKIGDAMIIVVANPLTGDCRELPAHGIRPIQLKMMQLVMHRTETTQRYQVILVGHIISFVEETRAIVYDSGTRVWTYPKDISSGPLIFGQNYWLKVSDKEYGELGPCAYDCAAEKLLCLDYKRNRDIYNFELRDDALVKDRLFVLNDNCECQDINLPIYNLCEYEIQVQNGRLRCREVNDHHDGPIGQISLGSEQLWACKGFLLVTGQRGCLSYHFVSDHVAWLYNLRTGVWLEVKEFNAVVADWRRSPFRKATGILCEMHWDATP